MKLILSSAVLVICIISCKSPMGPGRAVMANAPSPKTAEAMNAIKALAGSWEGSIAEHNNSPTTAAFAVTSGGSMVREIMGAGTEHEMTNVYHLDGDQIVTTHYCGAGNQPRMVATFVSPRRIVFELESIANYTGGEHGFMGGVELEFIDKNHVIQRWTNFKDGKEQGKATFELKRKK
ncbi:MAG: hypothetical protein ACKVS6_12405 [Planctomycetota bacterium]